MNIDSYTHRLLDSLQPMATRASVRNTQLTAVHAAQLLHKEQSMLDTLGYGEIYDADDSNGYDETDISNALAYASDLLEETPSGLMKMFDSGRITEEQLMSNYDILNTSRWTTDVPLLQRAVDMALELIDSLLSSAPIAYV